MKKSKIQVFASFLAVAVLALAQSCDSPVAATPTTNNTTGGGTMTYGWDATTTTYRIDPALVVASGAKLTVDKATGYLTVNYTAKYGQILIPLPTTDTQFMNNVSKVEVVMSSAATGTKKLAWKISNNATNSYGTAGEATLDVQYRDYTDLWSSTKNTMYLNGSQYNLKTLSSLTAPVALAICSNDSATNALVNADFSVNVTIESITFSK